MKLRAQLEHEIPFLPTDRVLRDRVEKVQEDLVDARIYAEQKQREVIELEASLALLQSALVPDAKPRGVLEPARAAVGVLAITLALYAVQLLVSGVPLSSAIALCFMLWLFCVPVAIGLVAILFFGWLLVKLFKAVLA